MKHWAIRITNDSNKSRLIKNLLAHSIPEFPFLKGLQGALFSSLALEHYIDEEERHGIKIIAQERKQPLRTLSSGEQKMALLQHLFEKQHDFILLDSPFDNLDIGTQEQLRQRLTTQAKQTLFVQIISRKNDLLPFISYFANWQNNELTLHQKLSDLFSTETQTDFTEKIPSPLSPITFDNKVLIELKNVSVHFDTNPILQNINWRIKKGEFWQLIGKNGSGKTTLLSMLTGENPKGYGQELFLFGNKKGSGESIWDIKKKIGYFTPAMTDKFRGYHTAEHMLISGLTDSIGLYVKPNESQLNLAEKWLKLIHLWEFKDTLFRQLSLGQKRLLMTTRAMIKHPLLLILDEPTAGLDDASAKLLVTLVNKIAKESKVAIIFVSHRKEKGLEPNFIYELHTSENGSLGSASQAIL